MGHEDRVSCLQWAAPSGQPWEGDRLLVSGSADWTARVWDAGSGACSSMCVGSGGGITTLAVMGSSGGGGCGGAEGALVTGAADGSVASWRLDGTLLQLLPAHACGAPLVVAAAGNGTVVTGERGQGNRAAVHAMHVRFLLCMR